MNGASSHLNTVNAVRRLRTGPRALRAVLQRRSCSAAHAQHATRTASDESAPGALSGSKSVRTVISHLEAAKSFFRRQTALAALRAATRARRVQRSTHCTRTVKAVSRVGEPSPIHSKECERRLFTPRAVNTVRRLLTAPRALRALLQRRSCSAAHARHAPRTASDKTAPRALFIAKGVRIVSSHLGAVESFSPSNRSSGAARRKESAARAEEHVLHTHREGRLASRRAEPYS